FLCVGARQLPHDQEQNEGGDRRGAEASRKERRRDGDDGRNHAMLLSVQKVRRIVALYKYIPDECLFRTSDVIIVTSLTIYSVSRHPGSRVPRLSRQHK